MSREQCGKTELLLKEFLYIYYNFVPAKRNKYSLEFKLWSSRLLLTLLPRQKRI